MLRVFITLNIFLFNIYACVGGYNSCVDKARDSKTFKNKSIYIPISKTTRLVFSESRPKAKILKHDPFLNLYLIKDTQPFAYPFKINMRYPSGLASINAKYAIEGRFKSHQVGLNQFAQFDYKIKAPSILTNSCCSLEGIVTPRGIIQKAYIKRFLDKKDIRYADIGIRVKDTKYGVKVVSYDPFMKNNPFKKGDYILSFDGKKIKSSAMLMQKILFAKVGSRHNVKVKRDGKVKNIKVRAQQRLSGGYKVETYLEKYGITFDKNLRIIKIDTSKKFYGLKVGDKLLKVNSNYVKTQKDVMKNISDFRLHPTLLFERDKNFQFFVNLD